MNKIQGLIQRICSFICSRGLLRYEIKFGNGGILKGGAIISSDTIIGDFSYIGRNCRITKAKIGRYVSIADDVFIGQGEHDLYRISNSALFYQDSNQVLTQGECLIQDDVWIGAGAIIRRGVTVGYGAVVGANSFVNRDVPPFAIVVGSPAKIVRYKFDTTQIDCILRSEWWKYDKEQAGEILRTMEENFKIE